VITENSDLRNGNINDFHDPRTLAYQEEALLHFITTEAKMFMDKVKSQIAFLLLGFRKWPVLSE
jgi:hypothetical protein